MDIVKYIHAADLHLDTAFTGLARSGNDELATRLADSTFQALENLTDLCETERPDFLLLAGDIYNHEDHSVRAQLRVAKMAGQLQKLDIPVFISYGNHDPLSSRLGAVRFPRNVVEFGPEPGNVPVTKGGNTIALVHGASHISSHESRNIAQLFQRDPASDCFQIGLLHCNVDGAVSDDRYAPCSLRDLVASGLDAWALGHAHKRQILSDSPFIAYSGCSQGIRPTECGPKGCLVVTASRLGQLWRCDVLFRQLGPIIWMKAEVDLSKARTLNEAMELIHVSIEAALDEADFCEGLIANITLVGTTSLATELSRPGACEELLTEAIDSYEGVCAIWAGGILNLTRPPDQVSILDRDDLLGEVGRLSEKYASEPEALEKLASMALRPLYGNRKHSAFLAGLNQEDKIALLKKAQAICQNLLENR